MRLVPLAAVAILLALSPARAGETYKVDSWPADIDTIPCAAWQHNSDGSWSLNGYVKIGASVLEDVGFKKGETSARILDRKCGK